MTDIVARLRIPGDEVFGSRLKTQIADELERLQARIDELMLEHCPDEMTPDQTLKWSTQQRIVSQAGSSYEVLTVSADSPKPPSWVDGK
jgi:hypothetical protein